MKKFVTKIRDDWFWLVSKTSCQGYWSKSCRFVGTAVHMTLWIWKKYVASFSWKTFSGNPNIYGGSATVVRQRKAKVSGNCFFHLTQRLSWTKLLPKQYIHTVQFALKPDNNRYPLNDDLTPQFWSTWSWLGQGRLLLRRCLDQCCQRIPEKYKRFLWMKITEDSQPCNIVYVFIITVQSTWALIGSYLNRARCSTSD